MTDYIDHILGVTKKNKHTRSYSNLKRRKLHRARKLSFANKSERKLRLLDRSQAHRQTFEGKLKEFICLDINSKLKDINQSLHKHIRHKSRSYSRYSGERAWNRLHALSKEQTEAKEKNFMMSYQQRQQEEMKECTFKPEIREYRNIYLNSEPGAFYDRVQNWKTEKDRKLSQERDSKLEDEHKI